MKFLIVEDKWINRTILLSFFQKLGETHVAVDGLEAIEAVKESIDKNDLYALVCMDVMMPNMDGITALKTIRRIERSIGLTKETRTKILMATAVDTSEEILEMLASECDGYMKKPYNFKDMSDFVFSLLSTSDSMSVVKQLMELSNK